MNREAQKLCCGRSGSDKPRAQPRRLVENLKVDGATVEVVRGDVVHREYVVCTCF